LYGINQIPLPLQNNEIKHYGLLSIDGGGSRGIIAAKIMEILESKIGKPFWTVFDLVGGSSTGGMLVLSSLQRRTRADELVELYRRLSSRIFPFIRALPITQYPHEPLEEELKNHFLELKLTATNTSPKLFVVTKQATDTQPYLLRNYDVISTDNNSFYEGCSGWLCRNAARATTAAPTYFKPFVQDGKEYSDGGVGFNNPVQLVFEEALSLSTASFREIESSQALYHFPIAYIVSIGTGTMPSLSDRSSSRIPMLGSLTRVKNAAELLVEHVTECENAHLTMKNACQRYGIPYFRFNTPLPERIRMDLGDEENLNRLVQLTNEYMSTESVQMDIEKLCKLIKDKQD
jgi:predicted acylesterase/phospholipase RssA